MARITRLTMFLAAAAAMTLAEVPTLAKSSDAVVLTENSAGITRVRPGESVEIRLKAQAGTGYSWKPTTYQSKIKELSSHKASGKVGGKEIQRFRFRTQNKGTYILDFAYGQPWKGGAKRAKTRSFTVRVR